MTFGASEVYRQAHDTFFNDLPITLGELGNTQKVAELMRPGQILEGLGTWLNAAGDLKATIVAGDGRILASIAELQQDVTEQLDKIHAEIDECQEQSRRSISSRTI